MSFFRLWVVLAWVLGGLPCLAFAEGEGQEAGGSEPQEVAKLEQRLVELRAQEAALQSSVDNLGNAEAILREEVKEETARLIRTKATVMALQHELFEIAQLMNRSQLEALKLVDEVHPFDQESLRLIENLEIRRKLENEVQRDLRFLLDDILKYRLAEWTGSGLHIDVELRLVSYAPPFVESVTDRLLNFATGRRHEATVQVTAQLSSLLGAIEQPIRVNHVYYYYEGVGGWTLEASSKSARGLLRAGIENGAKPLVDRERVEREVGLLRYASLTIPLEEVPPYLRDAVQNCRDLLKRANGAGE